VVYDTNFKFYKDRQRLRNIATEHKAKTRLIWVVTSKAIAQERAVDNAHEHKTRVLGHIPIEAFERLSGNLEPPSDNEPYIEVDGTKVTNDYIHDLLKP
jgi:hypothetical protein